jgi:hypothetical protein
MHHNLFFGAIPMGSPSVFFKLGSATESGADFHKGLDLDFIIA